MIPVLSFLVMSFLPQTASSQCIARWRFDRIAATECGLPSVVNDVSGETNAITGNAWEVAGVSGQALQFDGITGHIVCKGSNTVRISGAFTVDAWVAIGAYPFNWCPILQQQDGETAGFFFGIGDQGQVSFRLAAGGKWQGAETVRRIPLAKWAHVLGAYEPGKGVTLYINGCQEAFSKIEGEVSPADGADLWIGRNMNEMEQTMGVGKNRQATARILFDGLLDEITISRRTVKDSEMAAFYAGQRPSAAPMLPSRVLPAGPPGQGTFGAVYANLKYYRGWDEAWPVGDYPDVLVRFDEAPYRFVFWRGTSFIPHWVTDNGIWYNNEFTEVSQKGVLRGCAEPMSDKQCRFSHVRIIESSEARVVVHWRYALVDINYAMAYANPLMGGLGDMTDEIYTIYPDGICVRKITAYTSDVKVKREWHEGIVVMGPGMSPNDAIEPAGLTLLNNSGEMQAYSWEKETPPKRPDKPANANIQLINLKSRYKPFAISRPVDQPWFDVYAGEIRRDVSIYPWWNHWPTAFEPSSGRYALAADRASHSSLTHMHWNEYSTGRNRSTKIMLHGMIERPVEHLASIARSWSDAPGLKLAAGACDGGEYDQAERAYILKRKGAGGQTDLSFTVAASRQSPLNNLVLVINGWGDGGAVLKMNGRVVPRGKDFRLGVRDTISGKDLIVWARIESDVPVDFSLSSAR